MTILTPGRVTTALLATCAPGAMGGCGESGNDRTTATASRVQEEIRGHGVLLPLSP